MPQNIIEAWCGIVFLRYCVRYPRVFQTFLWPYFSSLNNHSNHCGICDCCFRSFRLYFAGDMSRDVPNGASAAEFQAALTSIRQDQASSSTSAGGGEAVSVTVSLDSEDDSGALTWRVAFLSHLEASPSFSFLFLFVCFEALTLNLTRSLNRYNG